MKYSNPPFRSTAVSVAITLFSLLLLSLLGDRGSILLIVALIAGIISWQLMKVCWREHQMDRKRRIAAEKLDEELSSIDKKDADTIREDFRQCMLACEGDSTLNNLYGRSIQTRDFHLRQTALERKAEAGARDQANAENAAAERETQIELLSSYYRENREHLAQYQSYDRFRSRVREELDEAGNSPERVAIRAANIKADVAQAVISSSRISAENTLITLLNQHRELIQRHKPNDLQYIEARLKEFKEEADTLAALEIYKELLSVILTTIVAAQQLEVPNENARKQVEAKRQRDQKIEADVRFQAGVERWPEEEIQKVLAEEIRRADAAEQNIPLSEL